MIIEEILSEIKLKNIKHKPKTFINNKDDLQNAIENTPSTFYPDMSRSIGDILTVMGMITSEDSPLVTLLNGYLLNRQSGGVQFYFDDGLLTLEHTHNFVEFGYVAEGQLHVYINNHVCIFNKGDIFLIDKNTKHYEKIFKKDMIVLFFSIANTFFDKSIHHETYDNLAEKFIKDFIMGEGYHFLRCVPKKGSCQVPGLFEKIVSEIWKPHSGTMHLVIGYMEWIFDLIPLEYEIIVNKKDNREIAKDFLFLEIRRYLENNYQDISLENLIEQYGHNMNYYNNLIKCKTGMTFSAFVQNLKLEKAEILLRTTDFSVEDVARQIGYENLSYFYRIFKNKFNLTPYNLRKLKLPVDHLYNSLTSND